jgi:hypothetical protein
VIQELFPELNKVTESSNFESEENKKFDAIHSKFQASLGYIARLHLKKKNKNKVIMFFIML